MEGALEIKNEVRRQFGFTVNVGISENKLLAKMASDFEKPDKVHTLFPDEIKEKMWPLPIGELFMAGIFTEAGDPHDRRSGTDESGTTGDTSEKPRAKTMGICQWYGQFAGRTGTSGGKRNRQLYYTAAGCKDRRRGV